jgi:hypothetical protein
MFSQAHVFSIYLSTKMIGLCQDYNQLFCFSFTLQIQVSSVHFEPLDS